MRQAPDCILIGEIRDKETMQPAIAYAQSGHLCLATLHANNSYHAMNRIISFFPLENRPALLLDLSVALRAIISQRLVRKPDGKRLPAVRSPAQLPPHRRTDRERRRQRHQGCHGENAGARIADLRTGPVPALSGQARSRSTRRWPMPIRRPTCSWLINNSEISPGNGKDERKTDAATGVRQNRRRWRIVQGFHDQSRDSNENNA